jgi:hypothetical protein
VTLTAKDKGQLTATGGMENYFGWLQKTMSASPWGNADLNKTLLQYTAQNISASFEFAHTFRRTPAGFWPIMSPILGNGT